MEIKIGQIWRHYKGDDYKIIVLAKSEKDGDDLVVYERQTDIFHNGWRIWVRPRNMFFDIVEWEGKEVPRFILVSEE